MTTATLNGDDRLEAYLAAILAGDRRKAYRLVDEVREGGTDLSRLYVDVFQPAMREIGRLWQENAITVADEHVATAITQAAMARAFEQVFVWDEGIGRSLVAACADTERHEVGLRMICDLLELRGWDTTYLGASVPLESLVSMTQRKRPDVVALSATITPHLPRLRAMIEGIRDAMPEAPLILVGGRPFTDDPTLATRLGADLTAEDAVQAVELLQQKFSPRR